MAPYYPWWGPICVFPTIMPIIMLVVLIMVLCLVFGRRGFCSPWHGPTRLDDQNQSPESGLEILKKRYAKGEITKEEFEQMQKDILRGALMDTDPTRLAQKRIEEGFLPCNFSWPNPSFYARPKRFEITISHHLNAKEKTIMTDTIQIELSNQSCSAGLEYARKQSAGPAKDAILCCEGMCLKGETARRAANLIGHRLVPERTVRICHGGMLEKSGGMRDLIQRANRVLILDGCGMACCSRLTRAAFPDVQPEVVFTNEMTNYAGNPFGIDEVPEAEITVNAQKVAAALVSKYYGGC